MRIGVIAALMLALACATMACGGIGGGLFRQYEYEEEMYLSLDGTATLYINSSIPALNALRGASFDPRPNASINRDAVRAFFDSPVAHVSRVTTSRRNNRLFVHVRLEVDDVRRLGEAPPFSWSKYEFGQDDDQFVYRQTVGPAAGGDQGAAKWSGSELTAFRLHLPSKIRYHNAGEGNHRRGNILVWEQPLQDRLRGTPIALDARMETQSILYRTLWLFGGTFVAVAVTFVLAVWWVLRRGASASYAGGGQQPPMTGRVTGEDSA